MEEIKDILFKGSIADRRHLFIFDETDDIDRIYKKFQLFTRFFYPKFFKSKDAPFHKDMVMNTLKLYKGYGSSEFLNIGFRGCSKSTFTKLVLVFCIANDKQRQRRYIKILSSDIKNSKQMVTDIYNMLIINGMSQHYPELFEKTQEKRQEAMNVIDFATGIKVTAGSIGQAQRGNVQGADEAARPDLLIFDDIETRITLRSAVTSQSIWANMQEAIDGLSPTGVVLYLANYVSERGNVHRLVERIVNKMIIPIVYDNGEISWPDRFSKEQVEEIMARADDPEGEYLCKPSASRDAFIKREELDKQIAIKPIRETAGFKIFKEYKPGHRIAGGHDIALGLGLDSSTSVFIDFTTVPFQVVGTYHSKTIKPDAFADEIARQGRIYGECMVAPEKNNAGIATIARLKQIYPISRIHATKKAPERISEPTLTELGWETNKATKNTMFNDLAEAIESGWIDLNDEDLIREAKSYTRDDVMDKEEDVRLVTRHFDLLTSAAIAFAMRNEAKAQQLVKKDKFLFNDMDVNQAFQDRSFE